MMPMDRAASASSVDLVIPYHRADARAGRVRMLRVMAGTVATVAAVTATVAIVGLHGSLRPDQVTFLSFGYFSATALLARACSRSETRRWCTAWAMGLVVLGFCSLFGLYN